MFAFLYKLPVALLKYIKLVRVINNVVKLVLKYNLRKNALCCDGTFLFSVIQN